MLRRIAPGDVRLGMYIHGFEGSWFRHPFWRTHFLLKSEHDLARVHESEVDAVIVDDEKGAAPEEAPRAEAPPPPPFSREEIDRRLRRQAPASPVRRPPPPPREPVLSLKPCSAASEFGRATKLVARSKRAVKRAFADVRLGKAIDSGKLAPLVDEITASITRNPSALISIARLKSRHEYTYLHSVAVCALMINLARELKLDEAAVRDAGMAGLLHDVGKMLVPEEILDKPGKLDDQEFDVVRQHPRLGHDLLAGADDVPAAALDVSLHHHERVDGRGYPEGLKGDAISLVARMGAVCDVYDAVTSDRVYKDAWSPAEALEQMQKWGGHFDPVVLAAFIRSIGIYPVGSLVRLHSDRLAVVTGGNDEAPTRPPLIVFHSIRSRRDIEPRLIEPGADEIAGIEQPERWGFRDWDARLAELMRLAA